MNFEGSNRVIVVRGDEYDGGAGADQLENFKTVELGHLNIQENEIGFQFGDGLDGFEAVGAFRGDFNLRMRGEKFAQYLAGELLVVDDHGAQFLFDGSRHDARSARSAGIVIATR